MGSEPRLLVVDDDALIREELAGLFASQPYEVDCVESVGEAIERLSTSEFSLALVDVRIGGKDGIELTQHIRDRWPEVDVIMITGHGSIENAVDAMKRGAVDYITKPFQSEEILMATEKALERRQMLDEIEYLRQQLQDRYSFANMVSRNPQMLEVFSTLEMLARNDVTVLITGESGTGKELAARAIHFQGKRKSSRFVAINCAALPENLLESELFGYERGAFTGAVTDRVGKIEHADGGTLFLDEVETISPSMQAKLLRVLEERAIERLGGNQRIEVDMRVVSATNEDLEALVRDGRMREDFYYRINVVPVHLPPLRERVEDISLLVSEFLRSNPLAREKGLNRLSEKALNQLVSYEWPGNIRELSNVMERAILRAKGDTIREVDVPTGKPGEKTSGPRLSYDMPLREYIKGAERDYLSRLLTKHRGSISPCAKQASVDQATLHRKIKAHGLRANDFRHNGRSEDGQ
jgi:DNA-binding NtrC family response regulator